jgi:hypothetical protein
MTVTRYRAVRPVLPAGYVPSSPDPGTIRNDKRASFLIRSGSLLRPHGVDGLQTREVRFVFRDNHAIVRLGDCAISRAQIKPAVSSNGSTRPANNACGPSGPENQRSNALRFFPAGF